MDEKSFILYPSPHDVRKYAQIFLNENTPIFKPKRKKLKGYQKRKK